MQIKFLKNGFFSLIFALVVILVLINFFWLKSAVLGLILGIFWLFGPVAGLIGARYGKFDSNLENNGFGLVLSLVGIVFISSLLFYTIGLSDLVILLIFILLSVLVYGLSFGSKLKLGVVQLNKFIDKQSIIFFVLYFIFFIALIVLMLTSQSGEALRSPFEVLPTAFFLLYFLATFILAYFLLSKSSFVRSKLILIACHFFLSFMIGVVVYLVGYGFDPFVHRAAELKLSELGYILPKPYYYIGQYSLVVFISKIFVLSIETVDKLLVPVVSALSLPVIAYSSLKKLVKDRQLLLISIVAILFVVTPLFFYTVPQSLANLFLILLTFILFGKIASNQKVSVWYSLFALSIFLIHPLSGIPAFILVGLSLLKRGVIKKVFILISSFLIPLFFLVGSQISNFKVSLSLSSFSNLYGIFNRSFEYLSFYSVYHFIYFISFNLVLLLLLVLIAGGYSLFKAKKTHAMSFMLSGFIILIVNLIVLGFVEYRSVIDYEQAEFAKRLWQIIVLVVSPLFVIGIYYISSKIMQLKAGRIILILLISSAATISLYLSYPHSDAFNKNRGYSISQADVRAVRLIEIDSNGEDFIVLSNQSTAAAGLQEFGFKAYYSDLFYYPIPTSSPLYEIYLRMVYDGPSLDLINEARDLSGVSKVYFVINDYWLDSKKRVEQASLISDLHMNVDNKVWVFRFEK
jgi:hypothetical protein